MMQDFITFGIGLYVTHQVFDASKVAFTGFSLLLYTVAYLLITKTEICSFLNSLRQNPAAVALGRLGGLKGSKARTEKLSPERRKGIAQKAAKESQNNAQTKNQSKKTLIWSAGSVILVNK